MTPEDPHGVCDGWTAKQQGPKTVCVELIYPNQGKTSEVEIGLVDVRAADPIRVRYDFDRDGWVILQASIFFFEEEDVTCDPDWQEVAFVQAWGREVETEDDK